MKPVPFTAVEIRDSFWSRRRATNVESTLPHGFAMLREKGYEENFKRAANRLEGGFRGLVYQDSDVYKLLQSAAAAGQRKDLEPWIERIEAAQLPDGYLNTHFQLLKPNERWSNLRDWHELYCAGHLIEAGVTDFVVSGNRRLLEVGQRFADHIFDRFGAGKTPGYPGHPELELALIQLYEVTQDRKYFDMAKYFVDARGSGYFAEEHKADTYDGAYWLDRIPIKDLAALEGHAVRALYLMCAVTGIVAKTGDVALEAMQRRVWQNLVERRTYVTGGVGSCAKNEGFTEDFDLPNDTAYQETCASIAMVMWNHRMAMHYEDTKFIDAMETALYNGVIAGVSLDGKKFFYENRLSSDGDHRRTEWFDCACCPPNISRLLSTLGGYAYAVDDNGIWINLYIGGSATTNIGGQRVVLDVATNYPWDGEIEVTPSPGNYAIHLRIPGWCENYQLKESGLTRDFPVNNGYVKLDGPWDGSEKVTLSMDMPIRKILPDPRVQGNAGLAAVARGPLAYCFEPKLTQPVSAPFSTEINEELGVIALISGSSEAIPYAFSDNRGAMSMAVWVPATFLPTPISF